MTDLEPAAPVPGATAPHDQPPEEPAAADFDTLLGGVLRPAYTTAYHLTGNRQDAEDLVQEAALRAFRAFASFRPGTNFRAWFIRILTNLAYSMHRARRQHVSLGELEDAHTLYLYSRTQEAGLAGPEHDPARLFLDRLTAADIARALASLPDAFRQVATLYFSEDFSYQEIAEVLDIPVGTVRSRLHRSRCCLQQQLWQLAEDEGLTRGPGPNHEAHAHD